MSSSIGMTIGFFLVGILVLAYGLSIIGNYVIAGLIAIAIGVGLMIAGIISLRGS